jgi:hypothetical protein
VNSRVCAKGNPQEVYNFTGISILAFENATINTKREDRKTYKTTSMK